MRDEYDFSDAVKHPLAGKFKGKYVVTVHYDYNLSDDEIETDSIYVKEPIIDVITKQQTSTQGAVNLLDKQHS